AVSRIAPMDSIPEDDLLGIAASAEQYSEHPLARAIVGHARARNLQLREPTTFSNEPGLGVAATIENQLILVGGAQLLEKHGAQAVALPADFSGTRVLVARKLNDVVKLLGTIMLAD